MNLERCLLKSFDPSSGEISATSDVRSDVPSSGLSGMSSSVVRLGLSAVVSPRRSDLGNFRERFAGSFRASFPVSLLRSFAVSFAGSLVGRDGLNEAGSLI